MIRAISEELRGLLPKHLIELVKTKQLYPTASQHPTDSLLVRCQRRPAINFRLCLEGTVLRLLAYLFDDYLSVGDAVCWELADPKFEIAAVAVEIVKQTAAQEEYLAVLGPMSDWKPGGHIRIQFTDT